MKQRCESARCFEYPMYLYKRLYSELNYLSGVIPFSLPELTFEVKFLHAGGTVK